MNRYFLYLIFLICSIHLKSNEIHPYHVGSLDITYNNKTEQFEIIGKFFMDDLEVAINIDNSNKTKFLEPRLQEEINQYLKKYFLANFKFKINNKFIKINYIGYEEDREMVYIYLESDKVKEPKKVELALSAIYNVYEDQANIVHITINKTRKSYKLNYPQRYMYQLF